ncbi:MAG: GTPase HflX [Dehalococcoidia bacterium]
MARTTVPTKAPVERAILAGVEVRGSRNAFPLDDSLEELAQLATTAGADVVGAVCQRVGRAQPSYMGRGKLEELAALAHQRRAGVVMLDDELTPAQQRIIEDAVGVKVIDRTALILDIFAGRARTKEGRLQVELAQHEYLLPRLAGQWSHLERLGGGIGTRGPGETQIETDRRLIRRRIQRLKAQLEQVRTHRALYRERRRKQGFPVVSLIGYTNAGKSTLFNTVSKADAQVQDRLFATLDPVTRRAMLPSGKPFLLTDTVGFIHKLPTALVAAFRATLEELGEADVLLHVVDITHPRAAEQAEVVAETLDERGLGGKAVVIALNKIDLAATNARSEDEMAAALGPARARLRRTSHPTAFVSAAKGWGIAELLSLLESTLRQAAAPAGVYEVG